MTFLVIFSVATGGIITPSAATADSSSPPQSKIVAGYVASWKELRITESTSKQLSHLLYAFGSISPAGLVQLADPCLDAGSCGELSSRALAGNFLRLAKLKQDHPSLRILISLGGWNGSKYFSDVAATTSSRARFAASIVDVFFTPYPGLFDGVDIDWEYPVSGGMEGNGHRPQDRENLTFLMAEIKHQLALLTAADGHHYDLTMAISASPTMIQSLDLLKLIDNIDWIGVMAYDYYAGTPIAGFNAPLFSVKNAPVSSPSVDRSVRYFLKAGLPASKLVLGIPFYGRAYSGVADAKSGHHGVPEPGWGGEDGIDFKDISLRHPDTLGFERHWDTKAQVPWLYNSQQRIWISYDDQESVARKANYVRSLGLAGVMIWELGGDNGTLLSAVNQGLKDR